MCIVASMYAWQTCAHQFVYGSLFAAVTTSDCHAHQTLGQRVKPTASNTASAVVHDALYSFRCIQPADLSCHSIGDVSCVLARTADTESSAVPKAIVLTKEHKALFPAERKRIEKAGGIVTNARLQGKPSDCIRRAMPHLYNFVFATATLVTQIDAIYFVTMPWTSTTHVCGMLWLLQNQYQEGGGVVVFLHIHIGLAALCSPYMQRASCSK